MTVKLAKLDGKPEIFYSIQGEGKNLGQPSVFIRTSLCNLHCVWCDTDYTWNWVGTRFEHVHDTKYRMEEAMVEARLPEVYAQVAATGCQNVVLTGGEPMLQQDALTNLMRYFRTQSEGWHFEIETNGTLVPTEDFDRMIDQYNVSPKLANSNNRRRLREKPAAYHYFVASPKAHFKFVLANETDLTEVLDLRHRYAIPPEKIYLMPEGMTPEILRNRRPWVVDICKQHGFYFTDRLHVHIYGPKRGV